MTEGIEQNKKFNMSKWIPIFVRSIGIGFGAIIAVVAVISTYSWYFSRPKPWDTKSITCNFDRVMTEGEYDTYVINYTMQNNTKDDYILTDNSDFVLAAKLKKQKSISPDYSDNKIISIDKPVFVPAQQRTHFNVHLNYPSKLGAINYDDNIARDKYLKAIKSELSKELPNIDGFMIYDKTTKYQIDLPRGW